MTDERHTRMAVVLERLKRLRENRAIIAEAVARMDRDIEDAAREVRDLGLTE